MRTVPARAVLSSCPRGDLGSTARGGVDSLRPLGREHPGPGRRPVVSHDRVCGHVRARRLPVGRRAGRRGPRLRRRSAPRRSARSRSMPPGPSTPERTPTACGRGRRLVEARPVRRQAVAGPPGADPRDRHRPVEPEDRVRRDRDGRERRHPSERRWRRDVDALLAWAAGELPHPGARRRPERRTCRRCCSTPPTRRRSTPPSGARASTAAVTAGRRGPSPAARRRIPTSSRSRPTRPRRRASSSERGAGVVAPRSDGGRRRAARVGEVDTSIGAIMQRMVHGAGMRCGSEAKRTSS